MALGAGTRYDGTWNARHAISHTTTSTMSVRPTFNTRTSCGAIICHIMSPRPGVVTVSAHRWGRRYPRACLPCPGSRLKNSGRPRMHIICLFSWLGMSSTAGLIREGAFGSSNSYISGRNEVEGFEQCSQHESPLIYSGESDKGSGNGLLIRIRC